MTSPDHTISSLEAVLGTASAEREAAERREQTAKGALEQARADALASTAKRAELVTALGEATATAEAASARLGEVRGQLADAQREAERLADAAAAGSDPAVRALAKADDTTSSLRLLADAHQRRAGAAEQARVDAEQVLAAHDAETADRLAHQREEHLVALGAAVDERLQQAVVLAVAAGRIFDERWRDGPNPRWRLAYLPVDRHDILRDVLLLHAGPLEAHFERLGSQHAMGRKTLAAVLRNVADGWRQVRAERQAEPLPPAAA